MNNKLKLVWEFLKGKKSYLIALAMVVVGLYKGETNLVLEGLALAGIRNGLSNEISTLITQRKK